MSRAFSVEAGGGLVLSPVFIDHLLSAIFDKPLNREGSRIMRTVIDVSGSLSSASKSSLVHTKETSGRNALPESFQQHIASRNYSAWYASGRFYDRVDDIEGTRYLQTFMDCRTSSWFARHNETGAVRVLGSACKLRWCRLCADAKRTYITSQIAAWLKVTRYHKFVTFTLKHSDDELGYQVDRLYKHFKSLRKTKIWRQGAKRGVWFFQIKRSKGSGQWHPHIHCIISGPWFDYKMLRKRWLSITGDSKVVGIHPVQDPEGCANEVARYAAAPANLETNDPADYHNIWKTLHGRRICGAWGLKGKVALNPPAANDKGEWTNIGSWSSIHDGQDSNPRAQAIIKAWQTQTPLPESFVMLTIPEPQESIFDIAKKYMLSDYDPTFFD